MNDTKIVKGFSDRWMILSKSFLSYRNGFIIHLNRLIISSVCLITNTKIVIILSNAWMIFTVNWLVDSQWCWMIFLCFANFSRFQTYDTHRMVNVRHEVSLFLLNSLQNSNDFFILVQSLIMSTLMLQWSSEISHWCNDHFLVEIWKIFQFLDVLFKKLFRFIKLTLWIICCSNVILYFDYF